MRFDRVVPVKPHSVSAMTPSPPRAGKVACSYPVQINDVPGTSSERTAVNEIPEPREFVRPHTEQRYAEIRQLIGHPPDVARLEGSKTVHDQIAEQKALETRGLGHPLAEHRATTEQLRQRAADGTCARDGMKRSEPINATGFRSDEAVIAALTASWNDRDTVVKRINFERQYRDACARGESEYELGAIAKAAKISSSVRTERALGSEWRTHVEGYTHASGGKEACVFSSNSEIKTIWRMTPDGRWYVITCYPQP